MKKFVLFLAVALVTINVSILSCKEKKEGFKEKEASKESCSKRFTLEYKLIKVMTSKYQSTQLRHINDKLEFDDGKGDARAIWFSLDDLKEFICQIERETDRKSDQLGIRIYYAAYPEKKEWDKYTDLTAIDEAIYEKHKKRDTYAERHTLVMVPTVKNPISGQIRDYLPNQGPALALTTYALPPEDEVRGATTGERLVKNSGSLFPPESERGMEF